MDTAIRRRYRYHQHRHVHFEGDPSSHSESDQSETGEEDEQEEADVGKKLDTTESDDSYSIDIPRRRPHMAYLKIKRNMTITLDSVEKIATNVTKLMGVVRTLQDKVDELTEIQAIEQIEVAVSLAQTTLFPFKSKRLSINPSKNTNSV